jgi:hypothetical protein
MFRTDAIACSRSGRRKTVLALLRYGDVLGKVNFGAAFGKGIHMGMGQTHMHKFLKPLLEHVELDHIDPTFLISHRIWYRSGSGAVLEVAKERRWCREDRV